MGLLLAELSFWCARNAAFLYRTFIRAVSVVGLIEDAMVVGSRKKTDRRRLRQVGVDGRREKDSVV